MKKKKLYKIFLNIKILVELDECFLRSSDHYIESQKNVIKVLILNNFKKIKILFTFNQLFLNYKSPLS